MFERFTEKAQRTLFFARYEASEQLSGNVIEPPHLLLGLIRVDPALFFLPWQVATTRKTKDTLRQEILQKLPRGTVTPQNIDMVMSDSSKRALVYAAEEAEWMMSEHIGTEHILLGILREEEAITHEALAGFGMNMECARRIFKPNWRNGIAAVTGKMSPDRLQILIAMIGGELSDASVETLLALTDWNLGGMTLRDMFTLVEALQASRPEICAKIRNSAAAQTPPCPSCGHATEPFANGPGWVCRNCGASSETSGNT